MRLQPPRYRQSVYAMCAMMMRASRGQKRRLTDVCTATMLRQLTCAPTLAARTHRHRHRSIQPLLQGKPHATMAAASSSTSPAAPRVVDKISSLGDLSNYEACLLDQFGVLHDGKALASSPIICIAWM